MRFQIYGFATAPGVSESNMLALTKFVLYRSSDSLALMDESDNVALRMVQLWKLPSELVLLFHFFVLIFVITSFVSILVTILLFYYY